MTDARGSFGLDRARILPSDDARFSRILRVSYPAGSVNPSSTHKDGVTYGGVQLFLPLRKRPAKSLHLRYYVRFPAGFDFARGGKLPGLFGVVDKDRRIVRTESGGFSTRYLWRRRGAGGVYAYLPGTVHGVRTPGVRTLGKGRWLWTPGRWICVEQSVRLNVPGRADGYVKVYVDGTQVLAAKGLTLRSTESVRVGGVFFSTFFGGGDRSFAPPRDQTVDFAGVAVSPTYIGPLPKK